MSGTSVVTQRAGSRFFVTGPRLWQSGPGQATGMLWTNLQNNFDSKAGEPFSIDAALRYLSSLDSNAKMKAIAYLPQAPAFVQTPLRLAFFQAFP